MMEVKGYTIEPGANPRHGAATCALEAGEPLHRVQQLLRHKDPRTTERYDHSRDRLDKSAAYGLGRALGGTA